MPQDSTDFSALVGSRICHDLISPVGAIGNGLELIGMSGAASGPELELISDSVDSANARIRFFRIAFGYCGLGQVISCNEIINLLRDLEVGGRIGFDWKVTEDVPREMLRAVFLGLMCVENVLPYGGMITVTKDHDLWQVTGLGRKVQVDPDLWGDLTRVERRIEISAGNVQFGLFPQALEELGKTPEFCEDAEGFTLRF
ncbi:histidine phosphotransferase family protein [Shimia sp. SDUM112013]|uniref:histidine phosphotransferase family protein n=1 Tax=Shimia sp. SDUM112013 TaxID=3136160 RepID=UPI0032EAEA75